MHSLFFWFRGRQEKPNAYDARSIFKERVGVNFGASPKRKWLGDIT